MVPLTRHHPFSTAQLLLCALMSLPFFSCSDADATVAPASLPIYGGTFIGAATGSSNGVAYANVPVRVVLTAVPGNGWNGTWTNGAASGTINGAYISEAPTNITFFLTQTTPCSGQFYGFGTGSPRSSDGQIIEVRVFYGGSSCLGRSNAETVFAQATLRLQ